MSLRPKRKKCIAGKTIDEIVSMKKNKRHRWYKTIPPEEKEEAMRIVERKQNGQFCQVCHKPLTGKQTKVCSDECRKKRKRETDYEYSQNNRERKREYAREYYQTNIVRIKKNRRKWRQNNREKRKEQQHEHYQKNKERRKKYQRERYQNNQEREKEYQHRHYRRARGLPEDWDLSRESSIEVIMRRWLQDSGIGFVEQYYIDLKTLGANWTRVDFFIEPNVCLYSDGDYHHGPENPEIQERDIRINRALEIGGHIVVRLSEADILAGIRPIEILEVAQ